MADLASTAVVDSQRKLFGGLSAKNLQLVEATVTLATMGSSANKVLASAFGLTKVIGVLTVVKSDDTRLLGNASYDGSYIQLMDPVNATNLGADFSGTFKFVIIGY